ncbi:MAG: hypothetical protein ACR2RV_24635 [Verrucomicrobiales bacterium]
MKKPLAISAVLMFLVALVGREWIGEWASGLGRDENSPRSGRGLEAVQVVPEKARVGGDRPLASNVEGENIQGGRGLEIQGGTSLNVDGSGSIGQGVTGDVSWFRFIRSGKIIGSGEPDERHSALIHAAKEIVRASLNPGVVVLDADAKSQFGSPVLVFAREDFDLTGRVQIVYDSLVRGEIVYSDTGAAGTTGAP